MGCQRGESTSCHSSEAAGLGGRWNTTTRTCGQCLSADIVRQLLRVRHLLRARVSTKGMLFRCAGESHTRYYREQREPQGGRLPCWGVWCGTCREERGRGEHELDLTFVSTRPPRVQSYVTLRYYVLHAVRVTLPARCVACVDLWARTFIFFALDLICIFRPTFDLRFFAKVVY
jgi:hypothetical protein